MYEVTIAYDVKLGTKNRLERYAPQPIFVIDDCFSLPEPVADRGFLIFSLPLPLRRVNHYGQH